MCRVESPVLILYGAGEGPTCYQEASAPVTQARRLPEVSTRNESITCGDRMDIVHRLLPALRVRTCAPASSSLASEDMLALLPCPMFASSSEDSECLASYVAPLFDIAMIRDLGSA